VGQDAHNFGFFNSLAVIATGAWGIAQALFGSDRNRWRRGTPMTLTLADGRKLGHSGKGDPERRTILLATTLETLPMGIKLFGPDRPGLKLAVLDRPSRRVLAAAPAMLAGWQPAWFEKAGLHRLDAEGFTLDIAEAVILDGEAFPAGRYRIGQGPQLTFVTP
jgi:diacylglycerol kinase (ATP)